MTGLPWSWTGYGGYLDAVQALKPALNIVGLVGHAAVRYDVMGDRAIEHDAVPTDDEIVAIADRVRESVAAGQLVSPHHDCTVTPFRMDGKCLVPSRR